MGLAALHFHKFFNRITDLLCKKKEVIDLFRVNKISGKKRGHFPAPKNDNNKLMVHYGINIDRV
jgi:hypothetical protein